MDSRQAGELMNRVVEDSDKIRQFMQEVFSNNADESADNDCSDRGHADHGLEDCPAHHKPLCCWPPCSSVFFTARRCACGVSSGASTIKVNNRLQDVISGIRVVKSFGQEQREVERFNDYNDRLMKLQRRNELFWATLYPIVTYLMTIGSFFCYLFGGMDVLNGRMTPGQPDAVCLLCRDALWSAGIYDPALPRMLMQLSTSLERIYDILEEESDLDLREEAKPHDIVGGVEFRNVTFGYKSYEPIFWSICSLPSPRRNDRPGGFIRRRKINADQPADAAV